MFHPLRKTLATIGWLGVWLAAGPGIAAERPLVVATNYPLQYFAERIGGDNIEVVLPVPPDIDPAFWQPDAAAIAGLQQADLILLNGAGYEKWLGLVSLPRRKLVDTSASFSDRYIQTEAGATHSHGREGAHSHAGTAFTTWLDLTQAAEQADAVREALSRLLPADADAFARRYADVERDLLELDEQLLALPDAAPDRPILASHPVYQYLARRYGLNLKSVLWEPDSAVPEKAWVALGALLREHPARWMLWEAAPVAENRSRMTSFGVDSVVVAPCANRPAQGDFLDAMAGNVESLRQVFEN